MTLLPPKAIDEFQALWKKTYGTELPREKAVVAANQFLQFVACLSRPVDNDALRPYLPSSKKTSQSEGIGTTRNPDAARSP